CWGAYRVPPLTTHDQRAAFGVPPAFSWRLAHLSRGTIVSRRGRWRRWRACGGGGKHGTLPVRGAPPTPVLLLLLVGFDCQAVRQTRIALSVCTPCLCTVPAERQWARAPPRRRGQRCREPTLHRGCRAIKMDIWRGDLGCATWGRPWTATRCVRLPVNRAKVDRHCNLTRTLPSRRAMAVQGSR